MRGGLGDLLEVMPIYGIADLILRERQIVILRLFVVASVPVAC